jgi:hypothetical protein
MGSEAATKRQAQKGERQCYSPLPFVLPSLPLEGSRRVRYARCAVGTGCRACYKSRFRSLKRRSPSSPSPLVGEGVGGSGVKATFYNTLCILSTIPPRKTSFSSHAPATSHPSPDLAAGHRRRRYLGRRPQGEATRHSSLGTSPYSAAGGSGTSRLTSSTTPGMSRAMREPSPQMPQIKLFIQRVSSPMPKHG